VHPNDSGDQKIAENWYDALTQVLSGNTPTDPTGQLGDVNSDGSIDIIDALLIAQYYVGLNPANFNAAYADVTRDNTIDIIDALRIAQCYVGIASCNF